jgi:hypothetical protein
MESARALEWKFGKYSIKVRSSVAWLRVAECALTRTAWQLVPQPLRGRQLTIQPHAACGTLRLTW